MCRCTDSRFHINEVTDRQGPYRIPKLLRNLPGPQRSYGRQLGIKLVQAVVVQSMIRSEDNQTLLVTPLELVVELAEGRTVALSKSRARPLVTPFDETLTSVSSCPGEIAFAQVSYRGASEFA